MVCVVYYGTNELTMVFWNTAMFRFSEHRKLAHSDRIMWDLSGLYQWNEII